MLTKTLPNDPSTLQENQPRTRLRNALRVASHPALKPPQRMALAHTFESAELLAQADRIHLESVLKNNVDAWSKNFNFVKKVLPPGSDFKLQKMLVDGEVAYIAWSAESAGFRMPLGTDTFVVRDGKIVAQTFTAQIERKA